MDDVSGLSALGSMIKYDDMEDSESESDLMTTSEFPPNTANTIPLSRKRKRAKLRNFAAHFPLSANYELVELRKKKLQLECAKLELELEKIPLECAKLELEIQLLQRDLLQPTITNSNSNDQTQ